MVKNVKGGKGHKSMARKSIMTKTTQIRLPEDELEYFAVVKKFYGNMCDVITHDNRELKCHIRGKFKGKSKRNAYIAVGKIILIGLRHYESTPLNCDLLCVYDTTAYSVLHSLTNYDLSKLFSISSSISTVASGSSASDMVSSDELIFDENAKGIEEPRPSLSIPLQKRIEKEEEEENHLEEEIDIDDI
jgi:translation initiation factor IF-1